jgi:hypothetical protein
MSATPEGKVKQKIKAFLVSVGAWYCMPATGGFGKSGVPDFLVCWKGKFIGIEAKAPGKAGNTTTLQNQQLAEIRTAGGIALVCDDVSVLERYLIGSGEFKEAWDGA